MCGHTQREGHDLCARKRALTRRGISLTRDRGDIWLPELRETECLRFRPPVSTVLCCGSPSWLRHPEGRASRGRAGAGPCLSTRPRTSWLPSLCWSEDLGPPLPSPLPACLPGACRRGPCYPSHPFPPRMRSPLPPPQCSPGKSPPLQDGGTHLAR